jgi:hypothetical protein
MVFCACNNLVWIGVNILYGVNRFLISFFFLSCCVGCCFWAVKPK